MQHNASNPPISARTLSLFSGVPSTPLINITKRRTLFQVPVWTSLTPHEELDTQDEALKSSEMQRCRPGHQAQYLHDAMFRVMAELDSIAHIVPGVAEVRFLDVGCAPGGFSSYILQKDRTAAGDGITLPQYPSGGDALLVEEQYLSRLERVFCNIIDYPAWHPAQQRPPAFYKSYNLIFLDARCPLASDARHYGVYTPAVGRGLLLLSQFILALEHLRPSGTIVAHLCHIETGPTAQLVYMLDRLARGKILAYKPTFVHAATGSFFLVAKGVGADAPTQAWMRTYTDGLRAVWGELASGGLVLEDRHLDWIVSGRDVYRENKGYYLRLVDLARQGKLWKTEEAALEELVEERNRAAPPSNMPHWSLPNFNKRTVNGGRRRGHK